MNNNFLELIKSRRTIRKFKPEQISKDKLDAIIEAGLYAPSGLNAQDWHFTIIQDSSILDELNRDIKEAAQTSNLPDKFKKAFSNENLNVFYGAPTVILISGEENGLYALANTSAASQNIMLAAHAVGLGSCWIGTIDMLFNSDKKNEYLSKLKIPKGYSPLHAIVVGEKDMNPIAPKRRENTVTYI